MANQKKTRVIAAMSGGVDSSVMAAMLVEQGYDVLGVTLNVEPALAAEEQVERADACCSLGAVEDARRIADKIGIPHYTLNFRDVFRRAVIDDFISEYRAGRTPNPCVRCNEHIKFEAVLHRLHGLDADCVATGHFARKRVDLETGRHVLMHAIDQRKDQSYVLYVLNQDLLRRSMFPLGEMTKDEVRQKAREYGLAVADKPESQEICFVANGDYGAFITRHVPDAGTPGPILNGAGEQLGQHQGIVHYTIGQRRGLGLSTGQALFVVGIDPTRNAVLVGSEQDLYADGLVAERVNWISVDQPSEPIGCSVKIRYRAPEVPATVEALADGRARVRFDAPQKSVTPGQSVVFYRDDDVVGGGTILMAERNARSTAAPVSVSA
ncbi:MAG TPA: tRNA 2-thiouridine(34) synthase MnmA [Chloroflexota bacterium]|nr:tRNA 2-thiouridine(34) synthase MnmA [Chloroflexota bacterium]